MMIEWLESIDRSIVLSVNGLHTPFWDEFMWGVSGKLTWIPWYLLLFFLSIRSYGWKASFLFLLGAIICVAFGDQISTKLFKDLIERYRPSHHALLTDHLHFYEIKPGEYYKGGMFGFVSSHATNTFAISTFAWLHLKPKVRWAGAALLFVCLLVCFSRIYLGVHYLSDIIGGAVLGILIGLFVHKYLFRFILKIAKVQL